MEKSKLKRNIESIIWTIVIVFLLRAFVVQGYVIPSGSMEDTLLPGDFVLAAKFVYGLEIPYTGVKFFQFYKPKRQKIVIFLFPVDKHRDFVKRCIGLPGDT
ncbi:MAG TPA: signal peptidase I, partial [candidate division WOR-3 bacterium]|nr:signal peptidase I [candidate division WOR-3 bacterium]